jgi:hypothetical protein
LSHFWFFHDAIGSQEWLVERPGSFPSGKPLLFFSPTFFSWQKVEEKNVGEKNKTPSCHRYDSSGCRYYHASEGKDGYDMRAGIYLSETEV